MTLWASVAAIFVLGVSGPQEAPTRTVVTEAAALPRPVYRLPIPPSELIDDREAILSLAREVDDESRRLLETFDVRDDATRRDLVAARRLASLARGDPTDARTVGAADSASGQLPLATDLLTTALLAADGRDPGQGAGEVRQAVRRRLIERGPEARSDAVALRREWALASTAYRLGELRSFADPQWRRNPVVSQDFAIAVLRLWVEIHLRNPLLPDLEAELDTWLDSVPETRADVWRERALPASETAAARPVIIAIWDGIDPTVFAGQIRREEGDPPDGRDNDGDGFVDEAEGLAFDESYRPAAGALAVPTPFVRERLSDYERYMRGVGDLAAGRRSPDVDFARAWRRNLAVGDVEAFETGLGVYMDYIHGTHVAGVALRGLSEARVVPVRITFPHGTVPPLLDEAAAARFVDMVETSVRYMRSRGVRVCNISWGFSPADIEGNLARNGVESEAMARAERARRIFTIMFEGMATAMSGAPEILFVVAAGNSGQDIDFTGDLPGGINLPNVLTVGAADGSGRPASFASGGASVDLYALGTDIDSPVPGGGRILWSGASLAAPQVVNTAARLLERNPDLCIDRLARLLRATATPLPGASPPLLNGRAAWNALDAFGAERSGSQSCPVAGRDSGARWSR